MGGVAFAATDVQVTANGARVLLFGGQRQGISGAMYSFEQASGDGWVLCPDGAEGAGPPPPPRTQHSLTSYGQSISCRPWDVDDWAPWAQNRAECNNAQSWPSPWWNPDEPYNS